MTVEGFVERGFEGVRTAFERNFAEHGDIGASLAVYHRGRLVVDLWGGVADQATGRPWERDAMALWMSSTKGATSTVVHLLADRGELDLDAPVAAYWPEFAAEGKGDIPVTDVLSHRSGVAALSVLPLLTLDDVVAWKPLVEALAAQKPYWEPGTAHGYHAQTFGFILDEVVRRATGRTIAEWLDVAVREPLGLDYWIGIPEEMEPRVAPMVPPPLTVDENADPRIKAMYQALTDPTSILAQAVSNPLIAATWDETNLRPYHAAPLTSANAIGTSRSKARMYAATIREVDGVRLFRPELLERAVTTASRGPDMLLPAIESHWGLGYAKDSDLHRFPAERCFGHGGSGGSLAFADPDNQVAFAYQMNYMVHSYTDPRVPTLMDATYEAIRSH